MCIQNISETEDINRYYDGNYPFIFFAVCYVRKNLWADDGGISTPVHLFYFCLFFFNCRISFAILIPKKYDRKSNGGLPLLWLVCSGYMCMYIYMYSMSQRFFSKNGHIVPRRCNAPLILVDHLLNMRVHSIILARDSLAHAKYSHGQ